MSCGGVVQPASAYIIQCHGLRSSVHKRTRLTWSFGPPHHPTPAQTLPMTARSLARCPDRLLNRKTISPTSDLVGWGGDFHSERFVIPNVRFLLACSLILFDVDAWHLIFSFLQGITIIKKKGSKVSLVSTHVSNSTNLHLTRESRLFIDMRAKL